MRRRMVPNFIGDVVELEERQSRIERVMQMLGVTPEYPNTFNVNDGARNRVLIGLIGSDYGIQVVDAAGNSVMLSNGTIVANAIKTGTLDCNLITVANLSASVITTGSLSATRISGGILDCSLMTVQNLNAGSITVGTFSNPNDRFNTGSLSGVKITNGTITGDKILANTIYADRIITHSLTTDQIAYNGVHADVLVSQTVTGGVGGKIAMATIVDANIGSLNANKITAGQITVGGAGAISAIYLRRSSSSTPGESDTFIRWEGGTRIWSDSSNRLGINSIGGEIYLYNNSINIAYFGSSNINFYQHIHTPNIDLALGGSEGSIQNIDRLVGYNDMWIVGRGDIRFPRDNSDGAGVRFEWGTGKIFSYSSTINLGGVDKTAIVPTSRGYRALYCVESPEVWFRDFCDEPIVEKLDPLFLEVTEPPYHFIKCVGGEYEVVAKRKGHAQKRFEEKSLEEFERNNDFWSTPKVSVKFNQGEKI